jgi:hypothetical protein
VRQTFPWRWAPWLIEIGLVNAALPKAAAESETLPRLFTNQGYAEDVMRATLAVDDPMAVFVFVLGNPPDRVAAVTQA